MAARMGQMGNRTTIYLTVAAALLIVAPAQAIYQPLYSFGSGLSAPGSPNAGVIKSGSLLYGMTRVGGTFNRGIIFKFDTTTSTFTPVHNFGGVTPSGSWPHGNLIQSGTNLYGLTSGLLSSNNGTLFRFDTSTNTHTVLHGFSGATDGATPYGTPLLSGNIVYGLTSAGGTSGGGTLFSYNTGTSAYTILHHFAGGATDGGKPMGSLVMSGTKLYGMSEDGGTANQGTMFQYDTANQSFSLLHSFTGGISDGSSPQGSLLVAGTKLYGTTNGGGAYSKGTLFEFDTQSSTYDMLHNFGANVFQPETPNDSLVMVNNRLYGMSQYGGTVNPYDGTVFEFDPATETTTVLHAFGTPPDGESPNGSLFFDGSKFYGMTEYGGASGTGMIFSLDLPEPSSVMIVAAGGLARALQRRRRASASPV